MSTNGARTVSALQSQLARVDSSRDQIAKAWLVDVILNSELAEIGQMPMAWATAELPLLIGDIVSALSRNGQALDGAGLQRAAQLAELHGKSTSSTQLVREISSLHSAVLSSLRMELMEADPALFGETAERLAALFTQIGAHALDALGQDGAGYESLTGVLSEAHMRKRLEQMVASTKRYGAPFGVLVLDVDGPGSNNGQQAASLVSYAVRGSIRVMDEAFHTEENGFWVLAPHQTATGAAQLAHRLTEILTRLQRASDLHITVSTGVAGCPEHGEDAGHLLRAADTAMWRARATGQPFAVAGLQDH
jgi:diguanylate cyclase (GGDEF)-like protein